jgi:hypothetical protein
MESQAKDAAVALNMYDEAKAARAAVSVAMRENRWIPSSLLPTGEPVDYVLRRPNVAALAFITALDLLDKCAERACATLKRDGLLQSKAVRPAVAAWDAAVPHLRGVRDSAQHLDERLVGKANGAKIALRPASDLGPTFMGDGAVNVQSSLLRDNYTCTTADGHHRSVAVTEATLRAAEQYVQALIDAVPWQ